MDKREKMANQLLMRGHATMDELLEASFGEWPVKGLQIVHRNDQRVDLFTRLEDYDSGITPQNAKKLGYDRVLGLTRLQGPRKIYVRDKSRTNSALGHEAIHVLQGDHSYRKGHLFGNHGENITGNLTGTPWGPASDAIMKHQMEQYFIPHKLKGTLVQAWEKVSGRVDWREEMRLKDKVEYLASGTEMQARLHQIMLSGYAAWRRLPATPDELQTALITAGVTAPAAINNAPRGEHAQANFTRPIKPCSDTKLAIQQMNFVLKGFDEKGREAFWNDTLPRLYADLIEMYGDKQGRARFGFGDNPRHAARLKHQEETGGAKKPEPAVNRAATFA